MESDLALYFWLWLTTFGSNSIRVKSIDAQRFCNWTFCVLCPLRHNISYIANYHRILQLLYRPLSMHEKTHKLNYRPSVSQMNDLLTRNVLGPCTFWSWGQANEIRDLGDYMFNWSRSNNCRLNLLVRTEITNYVTFPTWRIVVLVSPQMSSLPLH